MSEVKNTWKTDLWDILYTCYIATGMFEKYYAIGMFVGPAFEFT